MPDCNFVTRGKPVREKCRACGGPVLQRPNVDCRYSEPMLAPVEALAH